MKKHIALALTFSFGIAGCGGQADSGAEPVATEQALAAGSNYLALGDSIPFGYNMNANPKVAASQVGYPEILDIRGSEGRVESADDKLLSIAFGVIANDRL